MSEEWRDKQEILPEEKKATEELNFESEEKTGNSNWSAEKKVVICSSCMDFFLYIQRKDFKQTPVWM